jgi:hypothetical protein
VASMLVRRALYELQFNKTDRAIIYAKKLSAEFPDVILPQDLAKLILN